MRVEAIIFDMDNTLYDESQYVRSGFRAVSEYMAEKFKMDKDQMYSLFLSILSKKGRGEVFNTALEEFNMKKEETIQKMISVYRNHSPIITVFKDTNNTLSKLKQKHRLGLITDGVKKVQEIKVEALKIASFFDVITYAIDYGGKNNAVFLATLEKLKTNPANSVYIDDNPTQTFAIAKNLGIHTIRIRKGENKTIINADEQSKPDFEISNLEEILGIIKYIESS
jgi:putative hydrolase of the HAD superfamily